MSRRAGQYNGGGLSDPMCPLEERYGIGLELLRFFREINYPVCFSTKSDLVLRDKRYQEVFRGAKNFMVKVTIITLDKDKAARIEAGCPSPYTRLATIKQFSDLGVRTVLRLRPFIIGLSEKTAPELIKRAAENGAEAISTEFFCLESRITKNLMNKYRIMSEVLGFDIYKFYKQFSTGSGYLRLNRKIKQPYVELMRGACDKYNMRFYISDAHWKEMCHNGSCCGLPAGDPIWGNYVKQFTEAAVIARKTGSVRFSDIADGFEWTKGFTWKNAPGFNTGTTSKRNKYWNMRMYDWIRAIWNSPNSLKSPYKYFGGVLQPAGKDENGDLIYKYCPQNKC